MSLTGNMNIEEPRRPRGGAIAFPKLAPGWPIVRGKEEQSVELNKTAWRRTQIRARGEIEAAPAGRAGDAGRTRRHVRREADTAARRIQAVVGDGDVVSDVLVRKHRIGRVDRRHAQVGAWSADERRFGVAVVAGNRIARRARHARGVADRAVVGEPGIHSHHERELRGPHRHRGNAACDRSGSKKVRCCGGPARGRGEGVERGARGHDIG